MKIHINRHHHHHVHHHKHHAHKKAAALKAAPVKAAHKVHKPVAAKVQPVNTSTQSDMVNTVHKLVNAYRTSKGLKPLALDNTMCTVANVHSKNMAMGTAPFSHDGFKARIDEIKKSIKGVRAAGENLAMNMGMKKPAEQAVEGWIKSPGHQANMVGDYNKTGIGIAKNSKNEYYYTQLFIKA